MEYYKVINSDTCKIKMSGKFLFSDHVKFKDILGIGDSNRDIKNMELDVSDIEFVDSAALGLLLLLNDTAKKHSIKLTFLKPKGQVQKMFEIGKFYHIFSIVD